MKPAALATFKSMTGDLEGKNHDADGTLDPLVTTGTGNLIDPLSIALVLPWRRPDGSLASQEEIAADWHAIKARPDLAAGGGNTQAQKDVTTLRLDQDGLDDLFNQRLAQNEDQIRRLAPQYDNWPAAAQVGINSMTWAMGAGNVATFHRFLAAVNQLLPDFDTAAAESKISNATGERNGDDFNLFSEAAEILRQNLDPDVVFWPNSVSSGIASKLAAAAPAAGKGFGAILAGAAGIGLAWYGYKKFTESNGTVREPQES